MKKIGYIMLLVLLPLLGTSQNMTYKGLPSITWPKLYKVTYETVEDELGEYEKPIFSATVKKMENKVITVEGYMMPFDGTKTKRFILTSLPVNACFFCGNGGPESVIQVQSAQWITYTDQPIEIKGKLVLNDSNPDEMIYLLDEAEFIGVLKF